MMDEDRPTRERIVIPTPPQRSEVEHRLEAYRRDPSRVIPADVVFRELEERWLRE